MTPEELLEEIKHFFDVYKMLEPDKKSSTAGFEGARAAWREINASRERVHDPNAKRNWVIE